MYTNIILNVLHVYLCRYLGGWVLETLRAQIICTFAKLKLQSWVEFPVPSRKSLLKMMNVLLIFLSINDEFWYKDPDSMSIHYFFKPFVDELNPCYFLKSPLTLIWSLFTLIGLTLGSPTSLLAKLLVTAQLFNGINMLQ